MKIAITGGAGFIGSALTQAYLDAGHDVLVIDNLLCGSEQTIDPRARFYHVDIRDNQLSAIFQAERPDIVSHHAIQQSYNLPGELPLVDADVHIRGLLNLLNSCVEAQVHKFIFASSGNNLYGTVPLKQLPFTENSPAFPQQAHAISTIAGEWYVRYYTQHYGLLHSILRYADVYGETVQMQLNHLHHPLSYFIRMLADQKRPIIRTASEELRDHIFIQDVVDANLALLTQGTNRTLHISTGKGYSLKDLFQMVAFLLGSELEPVYLSGALEEGHSSILDNRKALQELNWQPKVNMLEGLAHAIELLGIAIPASRDDEASIPVVRNRENILIHA